MALAKNKQKIIHDNTDLRCTEVLSIGKCVIFDRDQEGFVKKIFTAIVDFDNEGNNPAGILMENVVNRAVPSNVVDLEEDTGTSNEPRNFNKNQTHVSGVVRLLQVGEMEVPTSAFLSASAAAPGSGVYATSASFLTPLFSSSTPLSNKKVGTVLRGEEDGYIKVFFNIA